MTLVEACEPLFQYICRLNRSARKGAAPDVNQVRAEIKALLADCKTRGSGLVKGGPGEWDKTEAILLYFVDFMIKQSKLPWARDWKELAHEKSLMAGDEDFFDELDKTLPDPSDAATERLGVLYACMGLGFTGWFAGDAAKLRQYMAQMASRLRATMDADRAAKICPEAYESVNTADLVEPPSRKIVGIGIALLGLGITIAAANVVMFKSKQSSMRESLQVVADQGKAVDDLVKGAGGKQVAMLRNLLDGFNRLSLPAKLVGLAITLGVLIGIGVAFRDTKALVVLLGGVGLVGVLLLGYLFILQRIEKRRESPMYKALLGNAAAAPMSVSEPARRARLDDLRKNFESGLEKFRSAGKSVYAVPWYVMVGEPGSGKTEMIRHSNIGFPPGLQDQLQGAGGTLNMHWWFTNSAVIIDTAGRLMFEEVDPGTTGEWEEMLKQLRRSRPNCPINGMLLVVPAESLIRDPSEAIERKGGRIAQQLDNIQRTLGVRFPVFVVITKCDLINGFREFFDEINDPQLQHQMLGWSNPAPLDTPFNPELIEDHLKIVQQRLVRRRTGLLLDPINTEDARARRTDQVDALYAFPESLMKVGPRLRRYLEMIFVAGEWSQKPLFLRGIYFNSAMREGAALDAELAEALGVPLESLPEGRVWSRDRSFFIRDVMISKVFRERGLVTRAGNTSKLQRARRNLLLGTTAGGLAILALLTLLGARSLGRQIVPASDLWTGISQAYIGRVKDGRLEPTGLRDRNARMQITEPFFLPIVERKHDDDEAWNYLGDDQEPFKNINADPALRSIAKFPAVLKRAVVEPVEVPAVFWPISLERNLAQSERAAAARTLIEGSILRPLINAAEVRLTREKTGPWSSEATGALAQLIRLEVAGLPGSSHLPVDVDALLQYALKGNPDDAQKAKAAGPELQEVVNWFYSSESGGAWPPPALLGSKRSVIDGAAKHFENAWTSFDVAPTGAVGYAKLQALVNDLEAFGAAEAELLKLRDRAGARDERAFDSFKADWSRRYEELAAAAKRIEANLDVLRDQEKKTERTLTQAFDAELAGFRKEARRQHDQILDELKPIVGPDGKPTSLYTQAVAGKDKDRAQALGQLREQIERSLNAISSDSKALADLRLKIGELDRLHIAGSADPAFRHRLGMYQVANVRVLAPEAPADAAPGATRAALAKVRQDLDDASKALAAQQRSTVGGPGAVELQASAEGLCRAVLDLAAAYHRTGVVAAYLSVVHTQVDQLAELVETYAKSKGSLQRPPVPLTKPVPTFSDRFNPVGAAAVLGDVYAVRRVLGPAAQAPPGSAAAPGVLGADALAQKFAPAAAAGPAYLKSCVKYWTDGLFDDAPIGPFGSWAALVDQIKQSGRAPAVNGKLEELRKSVKTAADQLSGALDQEGLSHDDRDDLDRLVRSVEHAKATLESEKFRADTDALMGRWAGLPSDPAAARPQVLSAWATGRIRDYVLIPDSSDPGPDLAHRYWQRFSQRAIETLAAEGGRAAAKAIASLGSKGFPIGPPGGPELPPADLEDARKAFETAKAAVAGVGGAVPPGGSGDTTIDAALNAMRTQDAVSDADRASLDRIRQVLEVLGGNDLSCKVTVLPNKPNTRGAGRISEVLPDLAFGKPGQEPLKIVDIYTGGNQQIGEMPTPSGPWEIKVYDRNQAGKPAVAELRTQWGGLGACIQPGVKRDGGGQTFDLELLLPYNGNDYSLWLRLDFSKPLPRDWPPNAR